MLRRFLMTLLDTIYRWQWSLASRQMDTCSSAELDATSETSPSSGTTSGTPSLRQYSRPMSRSYVTITLNDVQIDVDVSRVDGDRGEYARQRVIAALADVREAMYPPTLH